MVNKQKLWAHYEQIRTIWGTYIALFFCVPALSLCFSCLAHKTEIDAEFQAGLKLALLVGLKWYAVIMPIITVLFVIWFIFYSDRVEFTEDSILYYRWIFSKKSYRTLYNEITKCILSDGLWLRQGKYVHGRKIIIYNKDTIILTLDLYYKLCLPFILNLSEKKVQLVDDNGKLKSINNYFKIDFTSLHCDQQLTVLKYYCKLCRTKYKTGEEILRT